MQNLEIARTVKQDLESRDWEAGGKPLADIAKIKEQFPEVHEFIVSPDCEKLAVPVKTEDGQFTACVNGERWENAYEKLWYPKFSPDGRLTALVRINDEWTVAVDDLPWEERFEYIWNTRLSEDGAIIAAQAKRDMKYTVVVNGAPWSNSFLSSRDLVVSSDGERVVAVVQTVPLKQADTVGFMEGTWTLAVNDKPWDRNFINVYSPVISPDGRHVAAEVRLGTCEYGIAKNGQPWEQQFGCVWEPSFRSGDSCVMAPVRGGGAWTLAEEGFPIWNGHYNQLWHQKASPDGKNIAAVVAPVFGKWTIAVNDCPWKKMYSDCVLEPFFSFDGAHVAAIVRDKGRWTIAVDGIPWNETFDMVWNPVFSPNSIQVAAKVERNGRSSIAIDGKVWNRNFDELWGPVFSPDATKLLMGVVEDETYFRRVVSLEEVRF